MSKENPTIADIVMNQISDLAHSHNLRIICLVQGNDVQKGAIHICNDIDPISIIAIGIELKKHIEENIDKITKEDKARNN